MATKNFTQFSTAAPLTTGDYIVGYKEDGSQELKTTVRQIIDLVQDSDNQTLLFDENSKNLSITSGNTVSLSSFTTNTDFNSYKTEVASATATLLPTVTNYLSTNNVLISSIETKNNILTKANNNNYILIKPQTFGSFIEVKGVGGSSELNQTGVSFNNGGKVDESGLYSGEFSGQLSFEEQNIIFNGVDVSQKWNNVYTTVQANSASWEESADITAITTTVAFNSGNWNNAYETATVYQTNSATYATNTSLQSVSSLLTPLTLANILTSQLVLTTDFDSYKTNVASATAILLPISIYQSASGNWQDTFTTVQNSSASWEESADIVPTVTNYLSTNNVLISSLRVDGFTAFDGIRSITIGSNTFTYGLSSKEAIVANKNLFILDTVNFPSSPIKTVFTDGGNFRTVVDSTMIFGTNSDQHLRFRAGGSTSNEIRMTILSSGDVGIGTTLSETAAAGNGGLRVKNNLLVGGTATITGTISSQNTIYSADRQVVTTNTTTVPGTSAVTSILAVSALPIPQETGVLYILI